jgi:hypothetical protein
MKVYATQGVGRVYLPTRRKLFLGGAAVASQFLLGASSDGGGCGSDGGLSPQALQIFSLGAAAIASGGVVGLAMLGVEIGALALAAYAQQKGAPQVEIPKTVPVRYQAKADQGNGQVYDFPQLPSQGQGQGLTTLSTDGNHFVATTSPVEEAIVALKIVDATGATSDVNNDNVNYLKGLPGGWQPNSALFLLGLVPKNYTRILATTVSGRAVTIDLV